MRALTIPSLLLVAAAACGGPQQRSGGDYESIPLGQARAVELYEETITSSGYGSVTRNTEAQLTNGTGVNVDVLVPSLAAGFVYLNEQDRRDLEGELPEPSSASELYALLATQLPGEEQIHVLIVQDEDFEYIPNPRATSVCPSTGPCRTWRRGYDATPGTTSKRSPTSGASARRAEGRWPTTTATETSARAGSSSRCSTPTIGATR